MKSKIIILGTALALLLAACTAPAGKEDSTDTVKEDTNNEIVYNEEDLREIYLAGGCFWGLEEYFARVTGVIDATVGYANGSTENPTYQEVCYEKHRSCRDCACNL